MFPPITAYEVGLLKVSDIHTIAYTLYGNPTGLLRSLIDIKLESHHRFYNQSKYSNSSYYQQSQYCSFLGQNNVFHANISSN